MTLLIVARHGNTFEAGDPPRRVGSGTDLPLTAAGLKQGRDLGAYLRKNNFLPDALYTSALQRTQQTAAQLVDESGLSIKPQASDIFNELDYGPDENQTADAVLERLGRKAMDDWDHRAIVPQGWSPDAAMIKTRWIEFSDRIIDAHPDGIVMVVTSNGIARFALALTGDFDATASHHGLKLATGAFGILKHDGTVWSVKGWNIRP